MTENITTPTEGALENDNQQTAQDAQSNEKQESKGKGDQVEKKETAVPKKYLEGDALDSFVKIKVNGQEMELPVKEAIRLQQLEKASYERFSESAKVRAEAERRLKELESLDVEELLKRRGIDPVEYAEKKLQALLADMEKTPEQKELEELRALKAQKIKEEEELKTKAEKEKEEAAIAEYQQKFEADFVGSLERSGLPKHPYFVGQAAAIMLEAANQGVDLTPDETLGLIKKRTSTLIPQLLEQLPDEAFDEFLGKSNVERVRKRLLAKANARDKKEDQSGDEPTQKKKRPAFFRSTDEYNAWLKSK